jgi:hypothetical protein
MSSHNLGHDSESPRDGIVSGSASPADTSGLLWGRPVLNGIAQGRQLPARDNSSGSPVEQADEEMATATRERDSMPTSALSAFGIEFAPEEPFVPAPKLPNVEPIHTIHRASFKKKLDFFGGMAPYPELLMELATYLSIQSLISLYSISKDFHNTIDGHLSHTMGLAASRQAPESYEIFSFRLYEPLCKDDPTGRPHPRIPTKVRKVPSLRWLQMVVHRDKVVRDIIACMARQGHRMPEGMSMSLKKMWLLMDISTSAVRVQFMHNTTYFHPKDLYNMQMFIVKLDMRFNDPIDGPGDDCLRKIFLGQRGLSPLRNCLKRTAFTSLSEIIVLAVRYNYTPDPEHRHLSIWGVPPAEIGISHLEGWGKGRVHLMRPDELVMREAVRRRLDLKNHILPMMLWGYIDPLTGEDTPATDEEKYMSDDEDKELPFGWSDYEETEGVQDDVGMKDAKEDGGSGCEVMMPDVNFLA